MDHFNQRARSGRTHTASKLFIVNFGFQNMVHPFHHNGFKNLWNNWGKWNWTNIFFDRPWRFFFWKWDNMCCCPQGRYHTISAGITPSRSEVLLLKSSASHWHCRDGFTKEDAWVFQESIERCKSSVVCADEAIASRMGGWCILANR